MAHKPALTEGEMQSTNLRSIRDWIKTSKSRIKAKPNKTVVYAGLRLEVVKELSPADRGVLKETPMFKHIEKLQSNTKELKLGADFEMLSDVLGRLRDYPEIIDKDRQVQHFANAAGFFSAVGKLGPLLPNAKGLQHEFEKLLSEIYAGNAEGDLKVMDGVAEDYGRLEQFRILLKTELPKLLKQSDKLSKAGKEELLRAVTQYGGEFDRRYKGLIANLQTTVRALKKPQL